MDESLPDPQVIPYLLYANADAAMDWLVQAFGFTVRARDTRKDGTVRHGELALDHGGVIMLGSAGPGYLGPARLGGATQLLRIVVTDLDAHRGRTVAFTGEASEPQTGPPGWRACSVSDPEGHQWYFTEPVGAVGDHGNPRMIAD
jgi:PhnB protein